MKKLLPFILFTIVLLPYAAFCQKKNFDRGIKIKDKRIYFLYEDNKLKYFTKEDKEDSKTPVRPNTTFALTDNFANLYIKWLNPLRYTIAWKDSTYADERDQAIKSVVDLLVGQFGLSVSGQNSNKSNQLLIANLKVTRAKNTAKKKEALLIPQDGFNDPDLASLYLLLRTNIDNLTNEDIIKINGLTSNITQLDGKDALDILSKIDAMFKELYNIQNYNEVAAITNTDAAVIKKWIEVFNEIPELQNSISKILEDFTIADPLLNSAFKPAILKFINRTKTNLELNKKITARMSVVIKTIKNSVDNQSVDNEGYFLARNIDFEDGKAFDATITLTEFEYKSDTHDFSKKGQLFTSKIKFIKYDAIKISVSTGIFYASTTLKGFGVSNNGNQFIVKEDDITKSNAVTALFLNFNFGNSRYLSPLAQIGVDPTKKRPFLLMGAGFSIPSASIAFSGGPLWTWNQSLQKLSTSQLINSTTELDKDITYKFDLNPKGWYLGIQYNF